ncbi:MAG: hypothetical protein QGH52_04105, partial [Prochlorococcaceae cyanobacterium ETNP1_MAG_8]|nr:hypothetical protein [Prochlorococcaceae cyanobacterium ETNP1_MAG_8]
MVEISQSCHEKGAYVFDAMLKSIDGIHAEVLACSSSLLCALAIVLTVERHGEEFRGMALCPGKSHFYRFN